MKSNGQLFAKDELPNKSCLLASYEKLCETNFQDLTQYTTEELDWLQHIHNRYLEFYKEERRLHFGAMALVALLTIMLLPAIISIEKYLLALAALESLFLLLLLPYIFVYRRYEEGVRKKMRQAIILENERRLRREKTKGPSL